jgi:membrane protease YdiL (CAAX protease family)
MIKDSSVVKKGQIPLISLVPFLLIAFGLAWGIIALFIFLPGQMTAMFGQITGEHPLFFLAVYAPAIAAFIIVMYKALWYAFLIIGIPLIFYVGSAWKGNLFTEPFPFPSFQSLLIALLLASIKGPIEEFGWRGFALPLLQRKLAPIWAALILGMVWGFWHLPAFLLSGTQQSAWSFTPFFIGTVTISLIVNALFNASRGSILLPALMHFQLMNPIWPDAQPFDTYLLVGIAVLVVWFNRKDMFSKDGAVTEVIPGDAKSLHLLR